jgi:hypothetical protein
MVSYYILVILDRTVCRIATINPEYPECLDDAPTAVYVATRLVKNASKFDKIGSTPDCFEHVQNCRDVMPMFQDLSRI